MVTSMKTKRKEEGCFFQKDFQILYEMMKKANDEWDERKKRKHEATRESIISRFEDESSLRRG